MPTLRLEAADRAALLAHFLALGSEDRRLRFGFIARDNTIERYVKDIDFTRDAVFGVRSKGRRFDGVMHLALNRQHAEIGVSVLERSRGRGIGSALVASAITHARNRGIDVLFMQCLSENCAIMHIANRLGMKVVTEGAESHASLSLKIADQVALCDAVLRDAVLGKAHPVWPVPAFALPAKARVAA